MGTLHTLLRILYMAQTSVNLYYVPKTVNSHTETGKILDAPIKAQNFEFYKRPLHPKTISLIKHNLCYLELITV